MSSARDRHGNADRGSLRRQVDTRTQKQVLLVVTSGDSEKNYFLALKERFADHLTASVVVRSTGSEVTAHKAIGLARIWDEERAASPNKDRFDQIWLVVDREPHEDQAGLRQELEKLLKQSRPHKRRWHVAGTNPCLEYWYILHLRDCRSAFETSAKCVSELKKLLADYRKPIVPKEALDPEALVSALERARSWAATAGASHEILLPSELLFFDKNPSTGMHLLLAEFLDM